MNIHGSMSAHHAVDPAPQDGHPLVFFPSHAASQAPYASSQAPKPLATTWAQHVGAALRTWDRMTAAELLQSGGHARTLAGLIRERYTLSRAEAEQQVRRFLREQC